MNGMLVRLNAFISPPSMFHATQSANLRDLLIASEKCV